MRYFHPSRSSPPLSAHPRRPRFFRHSVSPSLPLLLLLPAPTSAGRYPDMSPALCGAIHRSSMSQSSANATSMHQAPIGQPGSTSSEPAAAADSLGSLSGAHPDAQLTSSARAHAPRRRAVTVHTCGYLFPRHLLHAGRALRGLGYRRHVPCVAALSPRAVSCSDFRDSSLLARSGLRHGE